MASWKKVIVSGSQAELSSLTLDESLIIPGTGPVDLNYGTVFQTISSSYSDTFLSGSFKGVHDGSGQLLTGVTGSKVEVAACNSNATTAKILFSAGTGTQAICSDNDLTYNTGTNTINATAAFAISATCAYTASSVILVRDAESSATNYITFGPIGSGSQELCTDSTLTYNPDSNTLTVTNISGTVSNATCATCIKLTETDDDATYNLVFATSGTYADPRIDNTLTYNAQFNVLTTGGTVVVGSGAAGTVCSQGDYDLILRTGNTNTGIIRIVDGADENISLSPNGTGKVLIEGSRTITAGDSGLILGTGNVENVCVTNDLNVGGDLIVAGDLAYLNVTNLAVEDRFILLNSGSSTGDGGIIVQNAATTSGSAFIFDDTADRWGFTASLASSATTSTPDAYVPAVVTSDIPYYQKNGNIRVESSEIYIYVE